MKTHADNDEMVWLRQQLQDLLDLSEGLTTKDVNFICDLDENWEGNFTIGQVSYLKSLWEQHIA